ncbi:hypothetical protein HDE_08230 [Halotydeus destructor]|nr:hypothetical protein HDE_08230 [Halotydeus destructor]
MERNRRIAKAYSRVPVLSITGTDYGFDGYKIGLNGFDNPMRDAATKSVKRYIGKVRDTPTLDHVSSAMFADPNVRHFVSTQGVRLKMDEMGNIIIKRVSNCDIFIRGWDKEVNSLSEEIIQLNGQLEYDKSVKLFDMKKFQASIARELRSPYPDRRKLEEQCICAIAFVKDSPNVLDLCSWVLLINIVALELLKSRFPPTLATGGQPGPSGGGANNNNGRSYRRAGNGKSATSGGNNNNNNNIINNNGRVGEGMSSMMTMSKSQPKFVSILENSEGSASSSNSRSSLGSGSYEDPYSLGSSMVASMVLSTRTIDKSLRRSKANSKSIAWKSYLPRPPELPPRDYD